jgi:hypothetical protein
VLKLDAATVLLQWAAGGLLFLWVTGRRREVGIGYGWLLRGVYGAMAVGAALSGFRYSPVLARDVLSILVAVSCAAAGLVSWLRRKAGVLHQRAEVQRRSQRISEMTGIEREEQHFDESVPEFPAHLDLIPTGLAFAGLVVAGLNAGDPHWLQLVRVLVGALFLGGVSDAMLLGHWYLTQPGLRRAPLLELVRIQLWIWPVEVVLLLIPKGMGSVLSGRIDDGYNGMLGWFWVACAITTGVLYVVTRIALKERYYSAVMAATGLLYLAILTAFGTDLVARALLAA